MFNSFHKINFNKKAISSSISVLILLIVVISVALPYLFYLEYSSQYAQVETGISNNYSQLKEYQYKAVLNGKPGIYYTGSSVVFQFVNGTYSVPVSFQIEKVVQLNPNNGIWQEIYQGCVVFQNGTSKDTDLEGLTINSGALIKFMGNDIYKDSPIAIITTEGNVFFLSPSSSIGPVSVSGANGITIVSEICTSSGSTSILTNITISQGGKVTENETPVVITNPKGSYEVNELDQYVEYTNSSSNVYTLQFEGWTVVGKAILTKVNSTASTISLTGTSAVLIAKYKFVTQKITLDIVNNGYKYSVSPIIVKVNGEKVWVQGSNTTQVIAGFVKVQVCNVSAQVQISSQEKQNYTFSNMTIGNEIYKNSATVIFISPSQSQATLYINYAKGVTYYLVTAYYCVYNPPNGYPGYPDNVLEIINCANGKIITSENAPTSEYFYFNNTGELINENSQAEFWLPQGQYQLSLTGEFFPPYCYEVISLSSIINYYNAISWGSYAISIDNGNIKPFSGQIQVNSPMTVKVYYAFTTGYNVLQ
jgi:lipopolysaccharide export system protein LptA